MPNSQTFDDLYLHSGYLPGLHSLNQGFALFTECWDLYLHYIENIILWMHSEPNLQPIYDLVFVAGGSFRPMQMALKLRSGLYEVYLSS